MGLVMKRAGAGVPSANRITLLRDADGDGVAETRSVLPRGLHSPFGMALVGDDALRRQHRRGAGFPYRRATRSITRPATSCRPARRADQPPLDQEPGRQPRRQRST
jgi:glucose/arabinose dehydrogenase